MEIKKGINQIARLREYAVSNRIDLERLLGIEQGFRFCFAVASQNSVGCEQAQDPAAPIIRASHLVHHLRQHGCKSTCDLLESKAYLPVKGIHFDTVTTAHKVAGWILNWYGLRPLADELHKTNLE